MNYSVVQADALDWLRSQETNSASLAITSPPYSACRTYGIGADRGAAEWVEWLRPIMVEACRVARLVALNVSDQVRDFRYGCGDLWLIADLTRLDGLCLGPMPYAWVRNGIPGSGGPHYHRRNWEPVYLLARPENLPPAWSDNTAFGSKPKCPPGGPFSNRNGNGTRANSLRKPIYERRPNGERRTGVVGGKVVEKIYEPPEIANAGNVIETRNGGGHAGHTLAHESEAPMNLGLAERFVCWFAPPDSLVIDMFAGSGTTAHAAIKHGRRFAGCDIRASQVRLCERRLRDVPVELFT